MLPSVSSSKNVSVLIGVLVVLLTLPVTLFWIGYPSKSELYRGVTREAGTFETMGRAFFEEKGDVDLLVFGSSLVRAAMDGRMLEREMSAELGRPAKVLVVGVNWPGLDIQYFLLRDLLAQRRVRMAVLALPVGQQNTAMPHVQSFRLVRYGDYPDAFKGLSFLNSARLYSAMVLGAPRHALSMVRANRVAGTRAVDEFVRPDNEREEGYYGDPYQYEPGEPPTFAADCLLYSPKTAGTFVFENEPFPEYHMHFLRRMGALLQEHRVRTLFVNVPLDKDRGSKVMRERLYWPDLFGPDTYLAGVPSASLFEGLSDDEILRFYADQHLNRNGREYFTGAVLPAILDVHRRP
jgi:hypothetical protein